MTQAPQSIKQKLNLGESTKDAVYIDAERRFQELETETKKLHDESKKFVPPRPRCSRQLTFGAQIL